MDHAINLENFVGVSYDIRQIIKNMKSVVWHLYHSGVIILTLLINIVIFVAQNKYPKIIKNYSGPYAWLVVSCNFYGIYWWTELHVNFNGPRNE